jgi:hypothetical protein
MALQTQMTVMDKMLQDKIDDLETHIDSLTRQKDIIQSIEAHTDNKLDFGDLLETYKLLVEEIDRTQQELQRLKNVYSLPVSGERGYEEEEEEALPSFNKFDLEKQDRIVQLFEKRGEEVKMSQEQILGFLRRNKAKWYTSSEISKGVNLSKVTVNTGLRRLKKYDEVQEKKLRVMLKGKLGLIPREITFYSVKNM